MSMLFGMRSATTFRPRVSLHAVGLRGIVALIVVAGCSCAHVPPEAVDLSQRMGTDLGSVHAANRELARSYFSSLRAQADAFVDEKFRPYVLARAMESGDLLGEIDRARKPGSLVDPLDVMEVFVEEVAARIDSFRTELHSPIDAQESEVLRRIDDVHEALKDGNAAITAHLISLRKVESEQGALLKQAGLPADFRAQLITKLSGASTTVGSLFKKAQATSAALDSLPGQVRRALGQ